MFPNYKMMQDSFYTLAIKLDVPSFIEFKDKNKSQQTIENYFLECDNKGAVLFCVARGKFSEGYDFKDQYCRGVIMVGIPNLNIKSPKI